VTRKAPRAKRRPPWLWRVAAGRPRLLAGLATGLIVGPLLPASLNMTTRAILAWDIGVIMFLCLVATLFGSERHMAADAAAQEEGAWAVFGLTITATAFSFAAIFSEFAGLHELPKATQGLHVALVALTLFVSWLMTHTTFALRYAHEYYSRSPGAPDFDRGLQFPGEDAPDYLDFMYFALVLGMTFQVSDVAITARKFRRLAALHGLIGFLFNATILALAVNLAAGFL
jgi:uncharacterized membrane protein